MGAKPKAAKIEVMQSGLPKYNPGDKLTHSLGFFKEFQRSIGRELSDWCYRKSAGVPSAPVTLVNEKTDLQKADDHIIGHDLEEAGVRMRKAAEKTAQLLTWNTRQIGVIWLSTT